MKALVYHGPGLRSWEDKARPTLQHPTDAIVQVTTTTLCGTDLHILKGDVPEVPASLTLGHEGVGVITEVGRAITTLHAGDRVLLSCITSCGQCRNCRRGMYSHCENGGWQLGHTIDGTQAEYVRVPHAATSVHRIPPNWHDEESLVLLSDILPTGYECGVLSGDIRLGDTVAIVGAGPIGLSTLLSAQLSSPARILMVDPDANRREVALTFGATHAFPPESARAEIMALTGGLGVEVAVEAVGVPESFELCQRLVAAGGHVANIGVHGRSVTLFLDKLWSHNLTLTTRLVDTVSTPLLLETVLAGRIEPRRLITHRFPLSDIMLAYDTFSAAGRTKALKVVLTTANSTS